MEQDVRLADATVVKVDDTISGANMYSDGDPGSMKVV